MTDEPERDEQGRWLPGRSGNPGGRPRSPWRSALETIASEQDATSGELAVEAILRRLADSARGGDSQAAAILLDRLIPKGRSSDEPDAGGELDRLLARLPSYLRHALSAALEAADAGATTAETSWAFETRLHLALDEETRARLYRTCVETLGIDDHDLDERLARLDPADLDHLDRITTQLRTAAIVAKLEKDHF